MNVIVLCEESQTVCKAFRDKGHQSFSCDILPASGGFPEWHIRGDAIKAMRARKWDLVIAHPPCTYLANSGVCWLHTYPGRWKEMQKAAIFFKKILYCGLPVCVENPVMHKYAVEIIGSKHTQTVQPWQFGHLEVKRTCFWLRGLPPLIATTDLKKETFALPDNVRQRLHYLPPSEDRAKLRSKTFFGIAVAMAAQWG